MNPMTLSLTAGNELMSALIESCWEDSMMFFLHFHTIGMKFVSISSPFVEQIAILGRMWTSMHAVERLLTCPESY